MSSTYTIGSFNIRKFNLESDGERKKDFDKIASIIQDEEFDVIAIQEAVSEQAVKLLVQTLGPRRWDYAWKSVGRDYRSEGYAFVWQTNRLGLVNVKNKENPRIYDNVNIREELREEGCVALVRPPLVGSFSPVDCPGGSNFQLRLINTHITFNAPAHCSVPYWKARKNELAVLSQEIYRRVSATSGGKLTPYTILLGDYNLILTGNTCITIDKEIPIEEGRKLLTVQEQKTTLKAPKGDQSNDLSEGEHKAETIEDYSVDYYSMNYDHFSYESTMPRKMRLTCSRVDALEKYFGNDLQKYRDSISDHVPIKLIIDLNV